MERYQFDAKEQAIMEKSTIPFAIYQYLDNRVVTILLSGGYISLFGLEGQGDILRQMDENRYRNVHPDDIARIEDELIRFEEEDTEFNVVYRSRINGVYHVIHAIGKHIRPEEGVRLSEVSYVDEGLYVGNDVVHDDSLTRNFSISLYESSLQRKTNYDFLTGLPNMTYFFELAKMNRDRVHAEGKHCSLCYANINRMRHFNRKYGFVEGNKLLKLFSDLLIKYFGSENSCRLAQDSFAFFALSYGLDRLLESLIMEFGVMTGGMDASVRIGIYPDTVGTVETSLACDRARYACNTIKNLNRSAFVRFDHTMLEEEANRQYVIDHLDQALEEGWIQSFYQPIVRTANGRVSDEEALARWIDPVKGMLSPAEFIPVLEDANLIYKVDLHMVDEILKKLRKQKEEGLYLVPNSVNLSRTDFDACDMVEEICRRVDASGLPRDLLTIEITESVIGSDFEYMKKQVERFRRLGFHVWMDDFGSGYSSLDVLQTIRFDVIKLDMRFMKQFNNDEKSRIIVTELMKMAIGLGIETVSEGVEREDQVEFLAEIGCTRLQGYYYCKPISMDEIFRRYREKRQIGFENPEESQYYEAIGRINLYDASGAVSDRDFGGNQYFNTFPMAILGIRGQELSVLRCNKSYREFMAQAFGGLEGKIEAHIPEQEEGYGAAFVKAIIQCANGVERIFVDERLSSDISIHALLRRIASNPVTGVTACNVIVLGVVKDTGQGVTYADVANSLSTDYIHMYYVSLETEAFSEYSPDPSGDLLTVERHGTDFFNASRKDAQKFIHPDDRNRFVDSFRKEKIVDAMNEHGTFTLTYRLLVDGVPVYVHMKAVRMSRDPNHIIIGVSNIDAQMQAQQRLERLQEEKMIYTRLSALSGNYICIYTVNPEDDSFVEFGASSDYDGLELAKTGEDFFATSQEQSSRAIFSEDQEMFRDMFTKDKVMSEIQESGVFLLTYRLMLEGRPNYVSLRAALVHEKDGPKLVIGVSDIDAQVRRDREYERLKLLDSGKTDKE